MSSRSPPTEGYPGKRWLSRHASRQLKFVIPGGAITAFLSTHQRLWDLVLHAKGGARTAALLSVGLGLLTVVLFFFILLLPWIRGLEPDYASWRKSGILSRVIPVLTASIVSGWSLLSFTLGKWAGYGYLEGMLCASGLYLLGFGLMGLIPAPKVYHH